MTKQCFKVDWLNYTTLKVLWIAHPQCYCNVYEIIMLAIIAPWNKVRLSRRRLKSIGQTKAPDTVRVSMIRFFINRSKFFTSPKCFISQFIIFIVTALFSVIWWFMIFNNEKDPRYLNSNMPTPGEWRMPKPRCYWKPNSI